MNVNEKKIKKVLVGVDFSDASRAALIEAVRLAEQQRGQILVLHIVEDDMISAIEEYSHLSRDEIYSSISERLEAFCSESGARPESLKLEVRSGHPVKDFATVCDDINPDLVVMGAWGSQRHTDKSTGTTVKQIAQECKSDVLLVRPKDGGHFSKVTACIDFSEYDVAIVKAADQLCLAQEGILEILHIFYPPWKKTDLPGKDSKDVSQDFETEYKAVLQGRLDALVPLNVHGVANFTTKTTVIETLKHSEGILNHLKISESDVAVIGARGQSRIESMILGRIAERIVTESPCSVYIVKDLG
jgi:nucleotide-binding universal stress UspA family protein